MNNFMNLDNRPMNDINNVPNIYSQYNPMNMNFTNNMYMKPINNVCYPANPMNMHYNNMYMNNMPLNMMNMNLMNEKIPKEGEFLIIFESNKRKLDIIINKESTIKELLKLYAKEIGVEENNIDKEIIFTYNNKRLNTTQKEKVETILMNLCKISVKEGETINFIFKNFSQKQIKIKVNKYLTFEELFEIFLKEIGYEDKDYKRHFTFFINGDNLYDWAKLTINEANIIHDETIDVIDEKNIMDSTINIKFTCSTGFSIDIKASYLNTVKELIKKFCREIELEEKDIVKDIIFLFNGNRIDPTSNDSLDKIKLKDNCNIVVLDEGNLLKDLK
jgi:hypothetical protein